MLSLNNPDIFISNKRLKPGRHSPWETGKREVVGIEAGEGVNVEGVGAREGRQSDGEQNLKPKRT